MVTVNTRQRDAIELLREQGGLPQGIHQLTLNSLVVKGLVRDTSDGNQAHYELTNAGRLLLADVDVDALEPAVPLAHPSDDDLFGQFGTDPEPM